MKFKIEDIYDKNINFLIGSGASYGLFPTLALNLKGPDDSKLTIEKLATELEKEKDSTKITLLFMHYFNECIKPALKFSINSIEKSDRDRTVVIENYEIFLKTILTILQRKKDDRRCNVFTTNYDGCFYHLADKLLRVGSEDFVLNDGSRGYSKKYLQVRNFNSLVLQSGIFDRFKYELPQINLINLHGSIYWNQEGDNIFIDYADRLKVRDIDEKLISKCKEFSDVLKASNKKIGDLPNTALEEGEIDSFWKKYNELPIVNPRKWKFHQTVFEEHYYQMLRFLSYELEKKNSIFIVFGFSFADEHIMSLVKRSLSNPYLQLYVFCFDDDEYSRLVTCFEKFKNVTCIKSDTNLDFTAFNRDYFTLDSKKTVQITGEELLGVEVEVVENSRAIPDVD